MEVFSLVPVEEFPSRSRNVDLYKKIVSEFLASPHSVVRVDGLDRNVADLFYNWLYNNDNGIKHSIRQGSIYLQKPIGENDV